MTGENRAGEERKVILRTEGLTKHYGGVHALQDLNVTCSDSAFCSQVRPRAAR